MANFTSFSGPAFTVGSQLSAGITKPQMLPYTNSLYGGLSILNGPVQIGVAPLATPPLATLQVGQNPVTSGPLSIAGIQVNHPVLGVNIVSAASGFNVAAPVNNVLGTVNVTGLLNVVGGATVSGNLFAATVSGGIKAFDIKHPNKEGWRLRHICPEGPTADVFVRGLLDNGKNRITLPDYWRGLVDIDTITVNLTPLGSYQELFVEKMEWGKDIIIKNNAGGPIKCYYHVMAERIDVDKNVPEYQDS